MNNRNIFTLSLLTDYSIISGTLMEHLHMRHSTITIHFRREMGNHPISKGLRQVLTEPRAQSFHLVPKTPTRWGQGAATLHADISFWPWSTLSSKTFHFAVLRFQLHEREEDEQPKDSQLWAPTLRLTASLPARGDAWTSAGKRKHYFLVTETESFTD